MAPHMAKMLAASSQASAALCELIEAVRDGEATPAGNIASGETLALLVDSVRLNLEAMDLMFGEDEQRTLLREAVTHFLGTSL